jgi:hypothetical protein
MLVPPGDQTAQGSARIQHAVGNRREPTGNNGQTVGRPRPQRAAPHGPRISAMTSGY